MGKVLVFANGVIDDKKWLRPLLAEATAVIAADGGGNHLAALGFRPDVVVGDMDSLASEIWEAWETAGTTIKVYSTEKDETDLELALLYGLERYEEDIEVFGTLGGRLDQMLANILLLAHPAFAGRRVTLVEADQRAWLVRDETEIVGQKGDRVSLIPLGGDVRISRTDGLQWKLVDEVLEFGPARGISNLMVANTAVVVVEAGLLLCVHLGKFDGQR
jgi:thiamine pyrophosphokinase